MRSPSTAPAAGLASALSTETACSRALAAAVAASAAPATFPAHSDAELMRLARAIVTSAQRLDALAGEQEQVEIARFREPARPEATYWQPTDFPMVWIDKKRLSREGHSEHARYAYTTPQVMVKVKAALDREYARRAEDAGRSSSAIPRLEAIIAAATAWQAERAQAWEAAGLGELDRAYERERASLDAMVAQVAALPAHTAEGVLAKVLAMAVQSGRRMDRVEAERLPSLLARADRDCDDDGEMLMMSVMVDAWRLAAPTGADGAAA